jgi:hypothetical protein
MTFIRWATLTILIVHAATALALAMVLLDQAESWDMALTQLRRLVHNPLIQLVYAGWVVCCGLLAFLLGRYRTRERGIPVRA